MQTAKNLTLETKEIIRDSNAKITKKTALKLSRLDAKQQKEAAALLATGKIRSVDEYKTAKSDEANSQKNTVQTNTAHKDTVQTDNVHIQKQKKNPACQNPKAQRHLPSLINWRGNNFLL